MADRYAIGEKTRRAVLGDAHVDRAQKNKTPLDTPFQELITESAWGTVWASEKLTKRERSLITLAILAGTGSSNELPLHLRATANTGASREDVMEVFQHVAIYAGVPKANHAVHIAKEIFAEMDGKDA